MVDATEKGIRPVPAHETKRFVPSEDAWNKIQEPVFRLFEQELGLKVGDSEPVLGDRINGEDTHSFPSLKAAFLDPESTVELLVDPTTQELMGYTFAFPHMKFNPDWQEKEGEKTAYIYATVLRKQDQGYGLVEHLIDPLLRDLAARGYTTAIRDAMVENGYAAAIDRRFSGEGIIKNSYEHNKYNVGQQKYYEIDIQKYLTKIDGLKG